MFSKFSRVVKIVSFAERDNSFIFNLLTIKHKFEKDFRDLVKNEIEHHILEILFSRKPPVTLT